MTRREFLDKLRTALTNDLSGSVIQENVDYYNQYIQEEVRGGRREEEVIAELGDPWVIARTVIDSMGAGAKENEAYEPKRQSYGQQDQSGNVHASGGHSWWKLLLLVLGVLGVIIVVFTVIGGMISLVAPILVPLLIVLFVVRNIGRRR